MANLATITTNILADSGIDDINVIVSTGSYANPAWITSLAWTKITGVPSFQLTSEKGQPNGYASLDSNGKVPLVQINDALIGNVNFQGLWNASTNTPTLVNPPAAGTKGYYYIVSTGGTFAGITFEVGDWIISNGSAWGKVDNTDAVSSVFGRTGNVVAANGDYTTAQVTESGNLYYTDARSRAALSFSAGSGAYNTSTGVITIPTDNNQIANSAGYITSAALSGYVPTSRTITINGTTQDLSANRTFNVGTVTSVTASSPIFSSGGSTPNITIQQAGASASGFLSNTDWNTFNNKQNTISLTTTGTSGVATLIGTTLNIPNYGGALSGYLPLTGGTLTGPLGGTSASFSGDVTANRYRGVNSLVLNSYTTVNPSSNVYLYSPGNDRDAWIYLDSADTSSNWGIYHRQIDSAVAGLPGNSIGFIGGGSSVLQGWISLLTGQATFNGNITATSTGVDGTFADAFISRYSANNNETNSIQTAVSSAASQSGFRFQVSNGAGSSGRTTVVDFLRDRQIFYGITLIGTTSNNGERLQVGGTGTFSGNIVLLNGLDRILRIGSSTNYHYDLQTVGDDFQIRESGITPRITIKYPNGNVLINTTTDNGARFQVNGNISAGNISAVTNTIGTVDMGLSGGGYATLGYNISYTSTANTYQFKVTDTSWMLDLGNANLFRVRYAVGTAGNTISYSNLLTINTSGLATFISGVKASNFAFNAYSGGGEWQIGSDAATGSGLYLYQTSFGYSVIISSSGAATFSSGVTAGGNIQGKKGTFGTTGIGTPSLLVSDNDQSNVRLRLQNTGSGNAWDLVGGLNASNNSDFSIYDVANNNTVLRIVPNSGNATFSSSVTAGGGSLFNANSGTLSADILTIRGGGSSGDFGFRVEANNGDDLLFVNALSYNVIMGTTGGNVLIGTTTDNGNRLRVNGTAWFDSGINPTKTAKNTYGIQIRGAFYGAPRLQLYDLSVDPNAYLGLGVDMSTAPYEFSNYFPRTAGLGRWSVGSWAGDFGAGQYVSGYNEKLFITESAAQFNVALTVSSTVTANGVRSINGGVDGTFSDAFIGVYSANNNETNAIQASVSSAAGSSGFRFQASNGGGSSGRTTIVDFLRDRQIFYGNVGIGVAPATNLHVQGPTVSYGQVRFLNSSSSGEASIHIGRTNQTLEQRWTIGQGVAGIGDSFGFYTGGSSRVNFQTNGNVLIGTTTDTGYRLTVDGSIYLTNGANRQIYIGSASFYNYRLRTDGDDFVITEAGVTDRLRYSYSSVTWTISAATTCTSSITATAFFESSDSKIKTLLEDKLDYQAIANVTAKYYEKNGKVELGYFAQDFETLLPNAVSKNEDGLLNLSYREVHTAKIAYLEERIKQLEKKYENN